MIGNGTDPRTTLISALHEAWAAEAGKVDQFRLQAIEDRIKPEHGGWTVPVASGVPSGNAYELARTLEKLQEIAESKSHLLITLFLDPFASPSVRK